MPVRWPLLAPEKGVNGKYRIADVSARLGMGLEVYCTADGSLQRALTYSSPVMDPLGPDSLRSTASVPFFVGHCIVFKHEKILTLLLLFENVTPKLIPLMSTKFKAHFKFYFSFDGFGAPFSKINF